MKKLNTVLTWIICLSLIIHLIQAVLLLCGVHISIELWKIFANFTLVLALVDGIHIIITRIKLPEHQDITMY